MEETISLKEIFEVIKKRFLLIIAFVLGAALVAAVVSYFVMTPKYEANSQFIVNQGDQDQQTQYNLNDIRLNVELINTYREIIRSERILDQVIETLNLDYSAGTLGNKINVSSAQNSQVVNVKVTDTNANVAADIANTTVAVFQKEIPILYNVDNVNVLAEAKIGPNPSPVAPNPKLNIAIAIVLGGMLGVGLAFLLEYLDNAIRTEQDIEKHLDLPILGVVSHIEDQDIREGNPMLQKNVVRRGGFDGTTQQKSS